MMRLASLTRAGHDCRVSLLPPPLHVDRYRHVVVLTGAGISTASGLPTYRGEGGLWTRGDTAKASNAATLAADPERVIRFFNAWRPMIRAAESNAAHRALALAQVDRPAGTSFTIITQNVDQLHQCAGSREVIELHGSVFRSRCIACTAPPFTDERAEDVLPRCAACGELLRPDVTLFGEPIPAWPEHESKRVLRECDLFVAVGTSGVVWPAAGFVRSANYAGARTAYVNAEPLDASAGFGEAYIGKAEELLPALFAVLSSDP